MPGVSARVAIVDFGLGNVFSIEQACRHAGMEATTTSIPETLNDYDAAIIPGVGAFPVAMARLIVSGLDGAIREMAFSGRPLFGICLGLQLLFDNSEEFGWHAGLGILRGDVIRLPESRSENAARRRKVPQIGWNRIRPEGKGWEGTPLEGLDDDTHVYFCHSYYVRPHDASVVVATTDYGEIRYCSAIGAGAVFGCQFHPERSGATGLQVYKNFARLVDQTRKDAAMRSRGEQTG